MSELKPCAHCGNLIALQILNQNEVDFIDEDNENWSDALYYQVVCSVNEHGPVPIADWRPGCGSASGFYRTKEEAVAAWNRRAQPDNAPLTLAELRGMDGEPVWIEDLENTQHSGWRICYWDRGKYLHFQSQHSCGFLQDECGVTWLPYRRKPEPEGGGGDDRVLIVQI